MLWSIELHVTNCRRVWRSTNSIPCALLYMRYGWRGSLFHAWSTYVWFFTYIANLDSNSLSDFPVSFVIRKDIFRSNQRSAVTLSSRFFDSLRRFYLSPCMQEVANANRVAAKAVWIAAGQAFASAHSLKEVFTNQADSYMESVRRLPHYAEKNTVITNS